MSLHNDLQKARIPHSCADCCRVCKGKTCACQLFYPENSESFLKYAVDYLRERVEPCKDYKLRRIAVRDINCYDDGIDTLDSYYVTLINSVLSEIRKGNVDYVFNFEQIAELLRFERLVVRYIPDSQSYEVRKER